jgi:hypothetical protein
VRRLQEHEKRALGDVDVQVVLGEGEAVRVVELLRGLWRVPGGVVVEGECPVSGGVSGLVGARDRLGREDVGMRVDQERSANRWVTRADMERTSKSKGESPCGGEALRGPKLAVATWRVRPDDSLDEHESKRPPGAHRSHDVTRYNANTATEPVLTRPRCVETQFRVVWARLGAAWAALSRSKRER